MRRIVALLLVGLAAPVSAQFLTSNRPDLKDIQHSRNMAMGGAYESLGYGAESIGGNPAALSLYKRYQIEASGSWDVPAGYGFGSLGLADSTNALATGVSYTFASFNNDKGNRNWAHLTTLGFSYAFGDVFHIGIAGRNYIIVGENKTTSISINAGIVVRPVSFITFGVSAHNIISVFNKYVPRYYVASISAQILGQLTPVFDLRANLDDIQNPRFAYSGGIEWLIAQTVPVRAGYQYDGIDGHQYLSGGIGWFSDGSGIDIAYRHEIGGLKGQLISLTLKLQL